MRTPLAFDGMPSLRWADGKEMWYKGTYVTEGTNPPGSAWAMSPIPRISDGQVTRRYMYMIMHRYDRM